MKIGIFGGTFDPVHIGHAVLALECWHELELDKVLFVPANISPFKEELISASPADRLNMLRLAVGHDHRFGICTLELARGGISYTVDTLKELKREFGPEAELFILAGTDIVKSFDRWKDSGKIMEMASLVAVSRPGEKNSGVLKGNIRSIEMPLMEISSTMIRRRIRARQPIEGFLTPAVVEYIRDKGLYR
ncbi:MAG: nicotinate-nucleotide adenylyltransferase [Candidatus Omnitrophota bacterium]|jgi:nicotinate-nucleotide adenylyltransferase